MIDQNPEDTPDFIRELLSQLQADPAELMRQAQKELVEAVDKVVKVSHEFGVDCSFGASVNVDDEHAHLPFGLFQVTVVGNDLADVDTRKSLSSQFADAMAPIVEQIKTLHSEGDYVENDPDLHLN